MGILRHLKRKRYEKKIRRKYKRKLRAVLFLGVIFTLVMSMLGAAAFVLMYMTTAGAKKGGCRAEPLEDGFGGGETLD
jgi:hypothetical protein